MIIGKHARDVHAERLWHALFYDMSEAERMISDDETRADPSR